MLQIPPGHPTRDEAAEFCHEKILEEANDAPLVGITREEAEWASTEMLRRLNQEGELAAARSGWRYVGGPYSSFAAHGYRSSDGWVVQLTESLADQRNQDGTLHPNKPGHESYGASIHDAVFGAFYPDGNLRSPRAPVQ